MPEYAARKAMKLSKLSLLFSATLLLIVGINGSISILVLNAFNRAQAEQDHRLEALRHVDDLRREMDTLSGLVRSYVVTCESRYLTYYYAILAIREGDQPPVTDAEPATFWSRVIAGTTPYDPRSERPPESVWARMRALGFEEAELSALERVRLEAEAIKALEQVAFAAAQGLYDPVARSFVAAGKPDQALAIRLVHGQAYSVHRARSAIAIAALKEQVDRRTGSQVTDARHRLRNWIVAAIIGMTATVLLALRGVRSVRQKVLRPIEDRCAVTDQLARGQYVVRLTGEDEVQEIQTLRTTFNSMADAIERDIDERESIGRELQEARARAEAATQAKSLFLANMSHEIRTPLNAVIGMADLLLRSRLPPRQRDYASKIRISGRALLDTLNDILDFSKIEAGRLELERIPFRLEDLVANAFVLVERAALEKGVELLFESRRDSAALLASGFTGDPLRIGQVLGNLLSNAVKFTPAGHVSLRIERQPATDGRERVRFSVEDTGIGLRSDQIEHLFDDFVQADGATTRRYGGTGLGLAIVRRLVEAMDGTIRVKSAPGQGSRFIVEIPLSRDDDDGSAPAEALPALRVLVADDYPEARLALIDVLQLAGLDDVEAVSCGSELFDCLAGARREGRAYDLLFLDWTLPDSNGGEVLRRLAAEPELAPRHVALMALPRTLDEEMPDTHPSVLHFCDKPLLPGALQRLCDEILGRAPLPPAKDEVAIGALDGMRVLLVEDNSTSRDVAVALLGRWGVEVDSAADGADALGQLAALAPAHYDLVFMDLQMPGMDGYEAITRIRAQPALAALPVYALSAHSSRGVLERCRELGMNGCLDKPYDLAELFTVLRRHYKGASAPATMPQLPAGASTLAGLEGIPGLDPDCAINDTGISPTLYPRLLAKFRDQFAGGPQGLRADVDARAWGAVVPFAHTLKGRAGLLGMSEIAAIAGRLEAAARAGDAARAQRALQALEAGLRPIVEGLDRVLPRRGEGSV